MVWIAAISIAVRHMNAILSYSKMFSFTRKAFQRLFWCFFLYFFNYLLIISLCASEQKLNSILYPCFLFVSNNAMLLVLSAGEFTIRCCLHASFALLQLNLLKQRTREFNHKRVIIYSASYFAKPISLWFSFFLHNGTRKMLFKNLPDTFVV